MKVIGFIPARGGSKGIPRKNIKNLNGVPLISHSIYAALASDLDEVVISTDDAEIMDIAIHSIKNFPAAIKKVVNYHRRPAILAGDEATIAQAVEHYLFEHAYDCEDVMMVLQPTSPLRTSSNINDVIKMMKTGSADSVISVCNPMQHPCEMLQKTNGRLEKIIKNTASTQRQGYKSCYYINGSIYAINIKKFKLTHQFMDETSEIYTMNTISSLDIDDQEVFDLVEAYLSVSKADGI